MEKKILIIEDNIMQSTIIDFFFEKNGFQTIVSHSAEDGFLKLKQDKDICLVTLDINLPGMSGLHLLSQIKSDSSFDHIPVVMISALGQEHNIKKALELGASDYFVKPVSLKSLEAIIEKYLK